MEHASLQALINCRLVLPNCILDAEKNQNWKILNHDKILAYNHILELLNLECLVAQLSPSRMFLVWFKIFEFVLKPINYRTSSYIIYDVLFNQQRIKVQQNHVCEMQSW